jgi:hypothetical protein
MPRVEAPVTGRSRSCGYGAGSLAVPGDPYSVRFAGVSGILVTDPSIEPSRRSPISMAR